MCVENTHVAGLLEQLSRTQDALEQRETNDSVQLEAARHDLIRLKDKLDAQTESAKFASTQCKAAQSDLKTLRQQLATQSQANQLGQAEPESVRQTLAAQLEDSELQFRTQTQLRQQSLSDLDALKAEFLSAKAELTSLSETHRAHSESSQASQETWRQETAELKLHIKDQAELLRLAEEAALKTLREYEQLKVGGPALSGTVSWQHL